MSPHSALKNLEIRVMVLVNPTGLIDLRMLDHQDLALLVALVQWMEMCQSMLQSSKGRILGA